jgi:tripartite-type tricarboxylate transporter receptor subunit TctC
MHVPYKQANQLLTDLNGGRIDFAFDPGSSIPFIKASKVRLLAVANPERSSLFPSAPTLEESALDIIGSNPVAVYAPIDTPDGVMNRLHREISRASQRPDVKNALSKIDATPVVSESPGVFATQLQHDRERLAAVLRENNIRLE